MPSRRRPAGGRANAQPRKPSHDRNPEPRPDRRSAGARFGLPGRPDPAAQLLGGRGGDARHRARARRLPRSADLDHQRLHADLRQPADGGRDPGRPLRPPAGLHPRRRDRHRLLAGAGPGVLGLADRPAPGRAGQGVGAAAALAGGTAALAQDFEGHARTRAFSLLGTTFGVGLAFGPVVTGFLIAGAGWRSIFLVGALVGAAALVLGPPRMRETRDPAARSLDWPGTVSFTAMLTALTVAVIEAPGLGWGSPVPCLLLAAATLLLMAFVAIESRAARPMLDLGLFR
nr:MFS transporter [Methylobacterium sp. WL64]